MKSKTKWRIGILVWLVCYIAILVYTIAFADFGDLIDPLIFFGIPIFSIVLIPTKPGGIEKADQRDFRSPHPLIRMTQDDDSVFRD